MTNELPFEQPIEPIEPEHEVSSEVEDLVDLGESFEQEESFSLSMDLYEQSELPIANNLKQKVEAVLYLKGQPMNLALV